MFSSLQLLFNLPFEERGPAPGHFHNNRAPGGVENKGAIHEVDDDIHWVTRLDRGKLHAKKSEL